MIDFLGLYFFSGMILMAKISSLCVMVVSAIFLSGCQSNGAEYAADVYDTAQLGRIVGTTFCEPRGRFMTLSA